MVDLGGIAQLLTALVLAANCWLTWRNGLRAETIGHQVSRIEKQTNGINDKLIASTAEAAAAKGEAKGLEQGRNEERK